MCSSPGPPTRAWYGAIRPDVVGEHVPGPGVLVEAEQLVRVAREQTPPGRGDAQSGAPAAAGHGRRRRRRQGPGLQVEPVRLEPRPAGRHAPGHPDGVAVDRRGEGVHAQGRRLDHGPGHGGRVEVRDEHVGAPVLGRHGGRTTTRSAALGHGRGRPPADHPELASDDHRRVVRPARRHRRQADPPPVTPVPALQVGAGAPRAGDLGPAHAVEVLAVADEHGPA